MPRVSQKAQAQYLSERDPVLARVIEHVKLPPLRAAANIEDRIGAHHFDTLTISILSQQISSKAATTIAGRFRDLFGRRHPTPREVLDAPDETLRSAGLSGSKVMYLKDLAARVIDGRLDLDHVATLPDDEVMRELVAVKGIGPWTAEMFLIFSLRKQDIFSYGDVGLVNAMVRLYDLKEPITKKKLEKIVVAWAPYRSLAARYLWASTDAPGGLWG